MEQGKVQIAYISTLDMPADFLTKPLGPQVFARQCYLNQVVSLTRFREGVLPKHRQVQNVTFKAPLTVSGTPHEVPQVPHTMPHKPFKTLVSSGV